MKEMINRREALYYSKLSGSRVRCDLCPHACVMEPGDRGKCRQRANEGGSLYSINYGRIASMALDPIEKKPLYHFHPGSEILSVGTVGCNLSCLFCQNYEISQCDAETNEITAEAVVAAAKGYLSGGVAYTYNEPLIWYEFVLETARLAESAGMYNVLVTNGYVNAEPFGELLPHIDAVNMDIKSIRGEFYRKLCGAKVEPALKSAVLAKNNALLEITNLIIPGENDSDEDLGALAEWVLKNLGADTPVHLSAYFPRYKMRAPATPDETLKRAHGVFSKLLKYVYVGNTNISAGSDTKCAKCGAVLIKRVGYDVNIVGLKGARCASCGSENNIVN